jgi:hypothetical protein
MSGENTTPGHTHTISVAISETVAGLIQVGEYKLRLGYPDNIKISGYDPGEATIITNPPNPGQLFSLIWSIRASEPSFRNFANQKAFR